MPSKPVRVLYLCGDSQYVPDVYAHPPGARAACPKCEAESTVVAVLPEEHPSFLDAAELVAVPAPRGAHDADQPGVFGSGRPDR